MKPTRAISLPGTHFVTFNTWQGQRLFVVENYVRLFLRNLYGYRRRGKIQLHAFVLMPEHIHLLITPSKDLTLEQAVQLIKGGSPTHLELNLEKERSGKEDSPTIASATPKILLGIGNTSIKIRSREG